MRKEIQDKWLDENSFKSQLVSNNINSLRPTYGFYVTVNNMEIFEDLFKDEYVMITKAYASVMQKLDKHYKDKKDGRL